MLRRRRRRRGMALMIVLSLLVLFLLMGVSFMMVASQTEKGARAQAKTELKHDNPKRLVDMAMYDVFVGPRTLNSVVLGHGLLRDMYGMDGFTGVVDGWQPLPSTGRQFLRLHLNPITLEDFDAPPNRHYLNPISGYYNGRVLTFLTGDARGSSVRIVGYNADTGEFDVMLPKTDNAASASAVNPLGDKIVVNGDAFSGTGFAYNDQNGTLTDDALWPNRHALARGNLRPYLRGPQEKGGANESYDAADLQNLALAAIISDPSAQGDMGIVPSFHRPALINYHMVNNSASWQSQSNPGNWKDYRRGAILRPMPWDHPGFTGSNPAFAVFARGATWTQGPDGAWGIAGTDDDSQNGTDDPGEAGLGDDVNSLLFGPWDVDNDNDGVPDSIWLDLGYSVQTDESGRMYKPLAAILCLDMDGKLNVNAHGNRWQFEPNPQLTSQMLAGGAPSSALAAGEGYGPDEINLGSIFRHAFAVVDDDGSPTPSASSFEGSNNLSSRNDFYTGLTLRFTSGALTNQSRQITSYTGADRLFVFSSAFSGAPANGDRFEITNPVEYGRLLYGNSTFPGRYGANQRAGITGPDPFGLVKLFEHPDNYFAATLTSYGTPDNIEGRLAFGLDSRGLLRYERSQLADNRADAAYELDLSQSAPDGASAMTAKDQPFSAAELEALLRMKDLDARGLPNRLRNLLSSTMSWHPDLARLVTTGSYDLPVPNVAETRELRQQRRQLNSAIYTNAASPQVENIQFGCSRVSDFIAVRMMYKRLFPGGTFDISQIDANSNMMIEMGEIVPELARVNRTIQATLAPDLAKGMRLDVNRPFGNGRDDNNNNVTDEHHWQVLTLPSPPNPPNTLDPRNAAINESWLNELVWNPVLPAYFDHDNDGNVRTAPPPGGTPDRDAFLARHQMAKHLYVLLMTLKNQNHQIDFNGDGNTGTPAELKDETARGIAQWCINVVDFRDADSIMTPFEYDIDPFVPDPNDPNDPTNGWNVDGVLGRNPVTGNTDDASVQQRRLVWGCERPEVLISETIAWHDRRTEDLPSPDRRTTDTNNPDDDFDQRLLPVGAFFVELYNPWKGDDRFPRELYDDTVPGVKFNKVNRFGTPVWRMIVAKGAQKHSDPDVLDPRDPGYSNRLSNADIDRKMYFTDLSAANIQTGLSEPNDFFPDDFVTRRIAPLLPGRYAVVGSSGIEDRPGGAPATFVSPVGRRTDADEMLPDLKIPDTRQIRLKLPQAASPDPTLDGFEVRNNQTQGGADQPDPTRLVPAPPFNKQPVAGIPINRGFSDDMSGSLVPISRSFSVSEPSTATLTSVNGYQPTMNNMIVPNPAGEPMYSPPMDEPRDANRAGEQALLRNGTTADYCTVHLQRLANPLAPWHPTINPYLTIDSMSTDITAFNGVTNDNDPNANDRPKYLATLERGRTDVDPTTSPNSPGVRQLWKHQNNPGNLVDVPMGGGGQHYFNRELQSTFGFLNENYGPIFNPNVNDPRNGFPESSVISPFPWLQWNNRPFASQYELTSVPRSKSYRLPRDYTVYTNAGNDPYRVTPSAFGHLLNFFETSDTSDNPNNAGHFYRLFDYTHVPSRFVGTDTYLNPAAFQTGPGTGGWHPPFNRVPEFREPGKVNINTVYDSRVWNAITAGHPAPNFNQITQSRRGYSVTPPPPNQNGILRFHPSSPTFFANPFRAAGERLLTPPVPGMARNFDVETTLSRSNSVLPAPNLQGPRPLLERRTTNQHDDSRRNPYFRHQPPTRLANLVTTRSNVYAIWITIGFFEVNPVNGTLGIELGSDTGEVKRHRGFYMVDRSIPVAYQPGENHNVDRAILVRRFIE